MKTIKEVIKEFKDVFGEETEIGVFSHDGTYSKTTAGWRDTSQMREYPATTPSNLKEKR